MLICQRSSELERVNTNEEENDWAAVAKSCPDIEDAPHFIAQGRRILNPLHLQHLPPLLLLTKTVGCVYHCEITLI